jgi:hypothetical protein
VILDPDDVEADVVGRPDELADAIQIGGRRHDGDPDPQRAVCHRPTLSRAAHAEE